MDVTFFENQPYFPKIGIQGEKTKIQTEMAEFQFFDNFDNEGVTPAPMEITAPTVPAAPVEIAEAEAAPTVQKH